MQNKTYTWVLKSVEDHIENEDSESNLNLQTEILKQQQKLSKKVHIISKQKYKDLLT